MATAWRYASETVALLAARPPKLRKAVRGAKAGHAYVVVDGTLIPIGRVAADRPPYSGRHQRHGMNLSQINTVEPMVGRGRAGVHPQPGVPNVVSRRT